MNIFVSEALATSESTSENAKSGGIKQFGINGWLLTFQVVNFLIIFFVLHRWVIMPLVKRIRDHQSMIEKSMCDAKKTEERLATINQKHKETLARTQKEAQKIIAQAHEQSERNARIIKERLHEELKKATHKARVDIERERAETLTYVRAHAADLVIDATRRVLTETVDAPTDRRLIEKILTNENTST